MNNKYKQILKITKEKFKYLNYSYNTQKIYIHYINEFLEQRNKYHQHLTSADYTAFLTNYKFSSISQQNQIISAIKFLYEKVLNKKYNKIDFERPRKEHKLPRIIDKETLKAKILAIIQAKGKKDRVVPLSENLLLILREYFKEYRPKEFLFNGQNGGKYSATSCNKIAKKYIAKDIHMHILRHSSFTHLLESGVDLRIIQSIAGHKSSKTTEIYTHVSKNHLNKIQMPI